MRNDDEGVGKFIIIQKCAKLYIHSLKQTPSVGWVRVHCSSSLAQFAGVVPEHTHTHTHDFISEVN